MGKKVRPQRSSRRRCEIKNKQALPNPPISAAAERMRRHRARRRQGLRLVQVQLRETEIGALIESGWLEERSRNNPNAVVGALHRLFDRVFNRMTCNAARTW
jgi:hypothetical protein